MRLTVTVWVSVLPSLPWHDMVYEVDVVITLDVRAAPVTPLQTPGADESVLWDVPSLFVPCTVHEVVDCVFHEICTVPPLATSSGVIVSDPVGPLRTQVVPLYD